MKYVISTQYIENYGSHSDHGTYAHNQHYWKFKGGTDYIVTGLDRIQDAVAFVSAYLHKSNTLGVKEFPHQWQSYIEWRDSINDLEADHLNFALSSAVCIDPRGQQVADVLEAITENLS